MHTYLYSRGTVWYSKRPHQREMQKLHMVALAGRPISPKTDSKPKLLFLIVEQSTLNIYEIDSCPSF